MTALYCSRHQTGWTSPPALCPVCHDAREGGGKVAHHDLTVQEAADNHGFPDDTPRVNYAKTCGTSALTIEAHKLERELRAAVDGLSEGISERERLEHLVYVPGIWKCAKCALSLVSNTLNANTGAMKANTSPQECLNGCGPMWRVTERDAGNDLCDRLDAASLKLRASTDYAGSCRRALCQIASLGESSMSDTEAIQAAMDIAVTALVKNPVNAEPSASTQSAGTMESALNPGPHSGAATSLLKRAYEQMAAGVNTPGSEELAREIRLALEAEDRWNDGTPNPVLEIVRPNGDALALLHEWLDTELDPEDEEYGPWMESFTARVEAVLAGGVLADGNVLTFSEPVDSSGGPIGADVAARQARLAVGTPQPGLTDALALIREVEGDNGCNLAASPLEIEGLLSALQRMARAGCPMTPEVFADIAAGEESEVAERFGPFDGYADLSAALNAIFMRGHVEIHDVQPVLSQGTIRDRIEALLLHDLQEACTSSECALLADRLAALVNPQEPTP